MSQEVGFVTGFRRIQFLSAPEGNRFMGLGDPQSGSSVGQGLIVSLELSTLK
jgi:hypothetical protein